MLKASAVESRLSRCAAEDFETKFAFETPSTAILVDWISTQEGLTGKITHPIWESPIGVSAYSYQCNR